MQDTGAPRPSHRRALVAGGLAALGLAVLALALAGPAHALPPNAAVSTPFDGDRYETCEPVFFDGSASSDEGPLNFTWTLPGETIQGPGLSQFTYTNFTTPGAYNWTLTVLDDEMLEDNVTRQIIIDPCSAVPVAVIAAPANGSRFFTDEVVNLSGVGSYDPDGFIALYTWSINGAVRGTGLTFPVTFNAGVQNVTLTVKDNSTRGKEDNASITLFIEVNEAPVAAGGEVSPAAGFAGDSFTFNFTYFDTNGENASEALLLLDGAPHSMIHVSGSDPRNGIGYRLVLPLGAGRHQFYFLAHDGNLTNISVTVSAPEVFENVSVQSSDRLAAFDVAVVPPHSFALSPATAGLPGDPPSLVAASAGYLLNASALRALNFTLVVAFSPVGLNASSALLMRLTNGTWQTLVTQVDGGLNTATIGGEMRDLPAVFRVFARPRVVGENLPPELQIEHRAAGGEYYPNVTLRFDANGTVDPENATVLFAWRFTGPGIETAWIPGPAVEVTFPQPGSYTVELRADDGTTTAQKSIVVEIRERPAPFVNTFEEPATLVALAIAVGVSAGLASWWRGRRPRGKRSYEEQYGALYKQHALEEKEYAQLFEKFADAPAEGEPPEAIRGER